MERGGHRISRRFLIGTAAGLTALAAVPALALRSQGTGGGEATFKASKTAFAYTTSQVGTSDEEFQPVPGLDDLEVLNRDALTASVSGDISGGPVEIRVVLRGGSPLLPGVARFEPSGASHSFSHHFVSPQGRGVACRTYSVEWRSPTGAEVALRHGSLILDYRFDDTTSDGLRIACPD